jgi:hypothetical protein
MPVPSIGVSALGDLGVSTLAELNRGVLVEIASQLQEYTFTNYFLRKGFAKTVDSGKSFSWRCLVNGTGTAENVGFAYRDNSRIVDTTVEATCDWRASKVDHSMVKPFQQMNASPAKIVDIEMEQMQAAMLSWAELSEDNIWGPPVAITDGLTPWGVATWVVKNASEGFNGGAPSGHTTIGLNPSEYDRWNNWTSVYTNVTIDDFIRKLNKALRFTGWKSPIKVPDPTDRPRRLFFSNHGLIGPLEEYLQTNNDNLGVNLMKYQGSVVINGTPIVWTPRLETDTTNPLYGLDMHAFRLYRLKNWWMRKHVDESLPGHHTVRATYYDFVYQYVMLRRDTSFVMATAATYPE